MGRRKGPSEVVEDGDKVPRNTANARERTRMRVLSKAFGRLKLTLPWVPPDTKLSKLDTLRLAMNYINQLQRTLEEDDNNGEEYLRINVPIKNKVSWSTYFYNLIYFVSIFRSAGLIPTLQLPWRARQSHPSTW